MKLLAGCYTGNGIRTPDFAHDYTLTITDEITGDGVPLRRFLLECTQSAFSGNGKTFWSGIVRPIASGFELSTAQSRYQSQTFLDDEPIEYPHTSSEVFLLGQNTEDPEVLSLRLATDTVQLHRRT